MKTVKVMSTSSRSSGQGRAGGYNPYCASYKLPFRQYETPRNSVTPARAKGGIYLMGINGLIYPNTRNCYCSHPALLHAHARRYTLANSTKALVVVLQVIHPSKSRSRIRLVQVWSLAIAEGEWKCWSWSSIERAGRNARSRRMEVYTKDRIMAMAKPIRPGLMDL